MPRPRSPRSRFLSRSFGDVRHACAASLDALRLATMSIRAGDLDAAIVGGVESWLTPIGLGSFAKLKALSRRPGAEAAIASRPFDRLRGGLVPADGAAALILETAQSARERGAPVFAKVAGVGATYDAYHPVAPIPDGSMAARSILLALADAGVGASDIDHVNCHGTSTPHNDVAETKALRIALGQRAEEISLTASKSIFGHTLGAAGALESAVTCLSIHHQFCPPTASLTEPDADCDLDFTPLAGRSQPIRFAVKVNFGFGGHNTCVVFADPAA